MSIEKLIEYAKVEMNKKPKFVLVQKEIEKNGIKVVVDMVEKVPKMCKKCNEDPRRNGSAFCIACSNKHKLQ